MRVFATTAAAAASSLLASVALAGSWPGPPAGPSPKVFGTKTAPPPAWIETRQHSSWLAYSSYCWNSAGQAACVDFIPPQSRPEVPTVRIRRGAPVRLHFAFKPAQLLVRYLQQPPRTTRLSPARAVLWTPARAALVIIEARTANGQSASYVFHLRFA